MHSGECTPHHHERNPLVIDTPAFIMLGMGVAVLLLSLVCILHATGLRTTQQRKVVAGTPPHVPGLS